jgi:hypothetical protein
MLPSLLLNENVWADALKHAQNKAQNNSLFISSNISKTIKDKNT